MDNCKFLITYYRDHCVVEEEIIEAEEKCFEENSLLDDFDVFLVKDLNEGIFSVSYSYWAASEDACLIDAIDEDDAIKVFFEEHPDSSEEEYTIKTVKKLDLNTDHKTKVDSMGEK